MERVQNIKYNRELFEKQVYFDKALKFVNDEIKKQQESCHHMNVILGHDDKFTYKKCLFCEKVMAGKSDDVPTIDATTFREKVYSTGATMEQRKERLQNLRELAIGYITENPKITDEELFVKLDEKVKKK